MCTLASSEDSTVTSLRTESVLEKFTPLPCKLTDILPLNLLLSSFQAQSEDVIDHPVVKTLYINMICGHLAYPMSLLYALESKDSHYEAKDIRSTSFSTH